MVDSERRISLEVERLRAHASWRANVAEYVSLPTAAAVAFHQTDGNSKATVGFEDYDKALNIAAAALSRLIPLFTAKNAREARVAITVDLLRQRFTLAATRLIDNDGTNFTDLWVRRSDLMSALSLIRRVGLPFSFALAADAGKDDAPRAATKLPTIPSGEE
jgi:hypothetical protein